MQELWAGGGGELVPLEAAVSFGPSLKSVFFELIKGRNIFVKGTSPYTY